MYQWRGKLIYVQLSIGDIKLPLVGARGANAWVTLVRSTLIGDAIVALIMIRGSAAHPSPAASEVHLKSTFDR